VNVFILAAGKAARFDGIVKQLLPIGETTIIERTIDQLLSRGIQPTIVCPELIVNRPLPYIRQRGHWITETVLKTRKVWNLVSIFLLGDVIYSNEALEKILYYDHIEPFHFFGTVNEIFGFSLTRHQNQGLIETAFRTIITHAERNPDLPGIGKLWALYNCVDRRPFLRPATHFDKRLFTFIHDYTTDIDTPEQYAAFLVRVVEPGILEPVEVASR
jgi:hypothetical protein